MGFAFSVARVTLKLFGKPVAVEEGGGGFRDAVCKARFETAQLIVLFSGIESHAN